MEGWVRALVWGKVCNVKDGSQKHFARLLLPVLTFEDYCTTDAPFETCGDYYLLLERGLLFGQYVTWDVSRTH